MEKGAWCGQVEQLAEDRWIIKLKPIKVLSWDVSPVYELQTWYDAEMGVLYSSSSKVYLDPEGEPSTYPFTLKPS